MLPVIDGFTILKKLRESGIQTPVLILSSKGEIDDRIQGLNIGADDYLIKPFEMEELSQVLNQLQNNIKPGLCNRLQLHNPDFRRL